MSGLGQMVAGIAHEINNPINFIHGNLSHCTDYTRSLIRLLQLYEVHCPNPATEIQTEAEAIDIEFIKGDVEKLHTSMDSGAKRIQNIVLSLRNFSRLDESGYKAVDIHEGIESTLLLIQHRLKFSNSRSAIQIIRDFDNLPSIECYAGHLNQAFINVIVNAIDALDAASEEKTSYFDIPQITIRTESRAESIVISIADNGIGIPADSRSRIFEPFFTTKEVGQGTGMGLAIAHQIIVEQHRGKIDCSSEEGKGTEFIIELPMRLAT